VPCHTTRPVGRSAARGLAALVNTARSVALPEDPVYFDRDAPSAADIATSKTPLLDVLNQLQRQPMWRQTTLASELQRAVRTVFEVPSVGEARPVH